MYLLFSRFPSSPIPSSLTISARKQKCYAIYYGLPQERENPLNVCWVIVSLNRLPKQESITSLFLGQVRRVLKENCPGVVPRSVEQLLPSLISDVSLTSWLVSIVSSVKTLNSPSLNGLQIEGIYLNLRQVCMTGIGLHQMF